MVSKVWFHAFFILKKQKEEEQKNKFPPNTGPTKSLKAFWPWSGRNKCGKSWAASPHTVASVPAPGERRQRIISLDYRPGLDAAGCVDQGLDILIARSFCAKFPQW